MRFKMMVGRPGQQSSRVTFVQRLIMTTDQNKTHAAHLKGMKRKNVYFRVFKECYNLKSQIM